VVMPSFFPKIPATALLSSRPEGRESWRQELDFDLFGNYAIACGADTKSPSTYPIEHTHRFSIFQFSSGRIAVICGLHLSSDHLDCHLDICLVSVIHDNSFSSPHPNSFSFSSGQSSFLAVPFLLRIMCLGLAHLLLVLVPTSA
jgi:hypothetical protein